MDIDSQGVWQAIEAGDSRFDGWVYCGVRTTGIYCRPSCPARTPKRANVRLYPTAAAAQAAGFRACKRCRPDAVPGSPEWDRRGDLAGRAMRLIADGVVDRDGVQGLARRLGYSERHVHRELVATVGAGPLGIARAQRAQAARMLLETTTLPMTEVAFASGFRSVRQFNATIREIFALSPRQLRTRSRLSLETVRDGTVALRLPVREPFDADGVLGFLGRRVVGGVEEAGEGWFRRSLRLERGAGVVELRPRPDHVQARFWLEDMRDLPTAVQRSRGLLDLDSDPRGVHDTLRGDRVLGSLVRRSPGRRSPAHVDAPELAVRALLGQQVSLSGASTLAARLVGRHGDPLARPLGGVTHLFPSPSAIAEADLSKLGLPRSRADSLGGLCRALAEGTLALDAGADRWEVRRKLLDLRGIGPWTVEYIAMRGLRDPDAFPAGDLGLRRALERLGRSGKPREIAAISEGWRPYRAYAVQHLWASLVTS